MKSLFFALMLIALPVNAYMLLPIDEVYDGDTIKTHISSKRLPYPLNYFSIRVRGIDTPELPAKSYHETGKLGRADCVKEAELALAARDYLTQLSSSISVMKVDNFEWGKYGGRVIADVKFKSVNIAEALISQGFAVPYDGGTKTHDWCQ